MVVLNEIAIAQGMMPSDFSIAVEICLAKKHKQV